VTEHQTIMGDSIEAALQRNDALRVLGLALASNGSDADPASVLRDIEEGGYTLRLTTDDERLDRNMAHQ
jgi:hypothetical protein